MDKYIPCSRCKYKLVLEYKTIQKLAEIKRKELLHQVCSHCEKDILQKRDKYNIDTPKHAVSYKNSINSNNDSIRIGSSLPPVKHYERDDKQRNSLHSPTIKLENLKIYKSSDSIESVATLDSVAMQKKLNKVCAKIKQSIKTSQATEGISKENKSILNKFKDTSEKQITRPGYALSEQKYKNFHFWFPTDDLSKIDPNQQIANRCSSEIIKDIFEKEELQYKAVKDLYNIAEPIGVNDWSTKIAKKFPTENKLKCFDVKSFETNDQKKEQQLKFTDMNEINIELETGKKSINAKIEVMKKKNFLPKKKSGTQKREHVLKNVSTRKKKMFQTPNEKNDKKQYGYGERQGQKSKGYKKVKDIHTKQMFDELDTPSFVAGTLNEEILGEQYEQQTVTETKSDEYKERQEKRGEGDELDKSERKQTMKKKLLENNYKTFNKFKEEKGKVSKIVVREPNIINKNQSLLEDVMKRFERYERSENLNPVELKVSKIDVRYKTRGDKRAKKEVKLSDNTIIMDSKLETMPGDQEVPKGTIRYALSDQKYIDEGWTKLPTGKTVRKMLLYKMNQSHPEFDWFNRNKHKKEMFYNTGEKLAHFEEEQDSDGNYLKTEKGDQAKMKNKLYYRNGKVALERYVPEEKNNKKRIVVYSKGEPDGSGRPRPATVLATFDHLGNGVVYDHDGNVRIKYNQTEGVLLDKTIGPLTHWKWHTLNDPPETKDVVTEIALVPKDMNIAKLGRPGEETKVEDKEIQAIAMENFIRSKRKKFRPNPIKTKAIRINDHFSLKIIDQATIYLNFKDHPVNIKTNIGMVLDQMDVVGTELAEIGDILTNVEMIPPRTASLAALQSRRKHVQRLQRKRFEREMLLRLKQSSIDRLYSGVSKPRTQKVITAKVDNTCQCEQICCEKYVCTRL